MENNQTFQSIQNQEEKLIRAVNYDNLERDSCIFYQQLDNRHQIKSRISKLPHQRVVICIKPKVPEIKTLYIAEKNHYISKKNLMKCGSRLAIGDHSFLTTHTSDENSSIVSSPTCTYNSRKESEETIKNDLGEAKILESSVATGKSISEEYSEFTTIDKQEEKCLSYIHPHFVTMNYPRIETNNFVTKYRQKFYDGAPLTQKTIPANRSPSACAIDDIYNKINHLEKKLLRQEMVFRSINLGTSSDEKNKNTRKYISNDGQPGCSYIEYSHIPETSAFQRYTQHPGPLSASKVTTIQKEHNSEQYGQDFTLYDNVTARGRRQSASVPCKRNDIPKLAAERVHKIRHKLNPVRDYRLMDTVHYLAQGEFAPRDDGIKLTPSREAVLSDIIWEDVCRTHWPNTRLTRRAMHAERCSTRSDLQRLIDSLLRERVAHIERRKRRHYRIVKLNHRHENCRPVGKTGDIIVANHKKRNSEDKNCLIDATNIKIEQKVKHKSHRRSNTSNERYKDECYPAPSCIPTTSKEPTCCYQTLNSSRTNITSQTNYENNGGIPVIERASSSSITPRKVRTRNPRLAVRKKSSIRKNRSIEPNLEHFILLPTLVVRTPSNMRRQKRFNELYHRILNVQLKNARNEVLTKTENNNENSNIKDISFNINISSSESEENVDKD